MPATFTIPLITVIPGQVIAASLWNNEFENIDSNFIPAGMDSYSQTDPIMQTATDPFPSGSTSRPTSLAGELERIRYILSLIIGQTYWYQHPSISLETLNTSTPVIPSGTVMVFYQASAPTGWTQVTTANDKALRVVSGTGGGSGGTNAMSSGLSHSHTVDSHNHGLSDHTHTMGNHTHTSAAHTHNVPRRGWGGGGSGVLSQPVGQLQVRGSIGTSTTADSTNDLTSDSTTPGVTGVPSSNTSDGPSTNTSGSTAPGTDTQAPTFQYIDVLLASKN